MDEITRRNVRRKYDDLDDLLHDVNRPDDDGFAFRWPRRSRLLALLGVIAFCILYLGTWPKSSTVDWSRYAYVQYANDEHNICHAFMVFEALHRLGSKADRVLLYNAQFAPQSQGGDDRNAELLTRAEKLYNVKLKPVRLIDQRGEVSKASPIDENTSWDYSITKLRAFELTEYDRVLLVDSDIILKQHVDELFMLPKAPMGLTRAYWSDTTPSHWPLSSLIMLLEPNPDELEGMLETLKAWRQDPDRQFSKNQDQEIINHRFAASSLVIPHRPYVLQTAEFRRHAHANYLGNINGPPDHLAHWDAEKSLAEAKIIHFNDWPLPKPWVMWPHDALVEIQPDCDALGDFQYSCKEREIWKDLYDGFRKRRKDLCRILSVPAPNWGDWKKAHGAPETKTKGGFVSFGE